jgi:hypothetical protein
MNASQYIVTNFTECIHKINLYHLIIVIFTLINNIFVTINKITYF